MSDRSSAPSLDRRSRRVDEVEPLDVERLVDEVGPAVSHRHGDLATRAQEALRLPPLILTVGRDSCTVDRGRIVHGTTPLGVELEVEPDALASLVAGLRSTYGLVFAGGGRVPGRGLGEILAWDHVLQALFDGRPLHQPGALTFASRDGGELDLQQTFGPDDDDEDIAHFIAEAGFCRLRGWVDPALLPSIASEVTEAARSSDPQDPDRWWATLEDGTTRCVRVMYLLESSPHMADLVRGPAYARVGQLFADGHRLCTEEPQAAEGLIKPLGVVAGLAEFPWHRDCSLGGHAYRCAAYAVGLPLSRTGGDAGYLRILAGSHRVSTPAPGTVDGFDPALPLLHVETQPGDLTVHVSCVLHGTRPSRSAERTVTYVTYSLPSLDPTPAGSGRRPQLQPSALSAARETTASVRSSE
jgi:hypothetical protein